MRHWPRVERGQRSRREGDQSGEGGSIWSANKPHCGEEGLGEKFWAAVQCLSVIVRHEELSHQSIVSQPFTP